jgi:3-phosphoshikimate 1-carboxyvinyltransferase
MDLLVKAPKAPVAASIQLPSSKSISNRILLLNALSYSPYEIKRLSDSDDTKAMLGVLNANSSTFDVGAAGTAMRFLTAFLSKIVGEWVLTGSERMKQRPIGVLVDALTQLGAKIEYIEKEGFPPLKIYGSALKGGCLTLPGNISSQYISALLMIAPEIEDGLTIELTGDIISRPYIDMTLSLMKEFGVVAEWRGNRIVVPQASYRPIEITVEADWSAASYWYEVVALNPGMTAVLGGLFRYSSQGDAEVKTIFEKLGVQSKFSQKGLILTNQGQLPGSFQYDFVNQPDLTQTLAVTCCMLNVPFKFQGLQTLKIKETDRIEALIVELAKLGFVLTSNGKDTLEWDGSKSEMPSEIAIDTYKDHRMAMAFAPAASQVSGLTIRDAGVVTKSYTGYWEDLAKAGYLVSQ